jgi:glycerophosphoryl diester phosphodiesterase
MALSPFAILAWVAYLALLQGHDINYYITARPPVFWVALGIASLLLLGAAVVYVMLYLRWIFSVPATLFEEAGAIGALRRSRRLMKGEWLRVGVILVVWGIAIAAGPILVTASLDGAGKLLFGWLGENLTPVVAAVAVLTILYLAAIELVTFIGLTVNALLIAHLYFQFRQRLGEDVRLHGGEGEDYSAWGGRRAVRRLLLTAAVVSVAFIVVSTAAAVGDLRQGDAVEVTAHRGSSLRAPENSLSAIEAAIEDGADYAEIDVQETADGAVVLLHDEDLMRVAGVNRKIWDISYSELGALDAGSWFAPEFEGERVPTLAEAIAVARGRIKLNIELKINAHEEALARRVVRILDEEGFSSQVVVSSLSYDVLKEVRELDPSLKRGYMVYQSAGAVQRLDVEFLSMNRRLVDRGFVVSAHGSGKEVHIWTVDDPARMSRFIDLGVDNITTNEPAILRAVLDERAALSDGERLLLAFKNWLWQ